MRLADDERGRVPFALVGVVLLVASATVATTISTREPVAADHRAELAAEGATAAARTALTDAVTGAARRAARRPVLDPTDTPFGAVLNDSRPFRDALRARIYLAARDALRRTETAVDGVSAHVTLPEVDDPESLRAAMDRVGLRALDGDPARVEVTVRNASVVVRRDGRVVDREQFSPTLVVRTPVLRLHDRVERFERLLDRGALAGDGLARRLSTRMYAIAWARGYAQYGGAPIANVVANRHVELATNEALLGLQERAFGRSDRAGRAAMLRATARVGATDLGAGVRESASDWQDGVLAGNDSNGSAPDAVPELVDPEGWGERAAESVTIGVNGTADRAYDDLLAGRDGPSLDAVVADVYEANVSLVSRVRRVDRERTRPDRPPAGWELVDEETTETTRVGQRGVEPPAAPSGFHRLATYGREVVTERRTVRRYRNGNRTWRTTATTRTVHAVGLAVVGRHARTDHAPDREVVGAHEPGGPLDGPNLAGVRDRAVDLLVTARGGPDALARQAADGGLDGESVTVRGETPDGLRDWLAADLADLREGVRDVTTAVPRREVAAGANPAAELADRLRSRRPALRDVPATYDGVAAKARVAARSIYLDRLRERVRDRANASRSVRDRLANALESAGASPELLSADPFEPGPSRSADRAAVAVDGAPPYLTLSAVTSERVPAADGRYHPLAARNLNVFTVPYGDAADAVAGGLVGGDDRVSLRSAARTLRGLDRTLRTGANESVRERRDELRPAVATSVDHVAARLRATLRESARLDGGEREAAVSDALDRWPTTATRALATANGSLADAVADESATRLPGASAAERDRLRSRLQAALDRVLASREARPPESAVRPAAAAARRTARERLTEEVSDAGERASERLRSRVGGPLSAVAAGMPVVPVPGWWYATLNVWHVTVRGAYARFAVSGRGGSPADSPAGTVTYVRQPGPVSLDVDGDGGTERLGRTTPVTFEAETTVAVVVPPGRGLGDLDGNADERSAGWPAPRQPTYASENNASACCANEATTRRRPASAGPPTRPRSPGWSSRSAWSGLRERPVSSPTGSTPSGPATTPG